MPTLTPMRNSSKGPKVHTRWALGAESELFCPGEFPYGNLSMPTFHLGEDFQGKAVNSIEIPFCERSQNRHQGAKSMASMMTTGFILSPTQS